MEEAFNGLVKHVKSGMDTTIGWFRSLPFVGTYLDYAAYGFSVYVIGHFYLGWW